MISTFFGIIFDWDLIINKIVLIGTALFSGGTIWKLVQSILNRHKEKAAAEAEMLKKRAETESIITNASRDVIIMLRQEITALHKSYQTLSKEFANFKYRAAKEMAEEQLSCSDKINKLTLRITQLENDAKNRQ